MANEGPLMPDWILKVYDAAKGLVPKNFVGQIEINVFKGGISNVTVKQSYKPMDTAQRPDR